MYAWRLRKAVYKSRDANVPSGTCPRAHNTVLALIDEGIMTGTERGSYNWLITQGGADNTGPDVMGQMPAPWVWQCDNVDIMNNRAHHYNSNPVSHIQGVQK